VPQIKRFIRINSELNTNKPLDFMSVARFVWINASLTLAEINRQIDTTEELLRLWEEF
jgi:hypothetical protein